MNDTPPTHAPALRSALHFAALGLAFPLTCLAYPRWVKLSWSGVPEWLTDGRPSLGWVYASALCFLLTLFNLFLLEPLVRRVWGVGLRRPDEPRAGGLLFYPLSLAVAFLVFPAYAVAAAWAALAAGDAAARTVGSRVPHPALPWNARKSWAGLGAFVAAAAPACVLLLEWCPCPLFLTRGGHPEWQYVWTLAVLAAVTGALLESLDGPGDDNLRIVLGVGLLTWLAAEVLSLASRRMPEARAFQPEWFLHALAANAVLAGLVWRFRFADTAGAVAGGLLGTAVYYLARPSGFGLLVLFVAAGSLLSRLGAARKEARHAAEARGGKRGLANVAANLAVPTLCCVAYAATRGHPAALLAYAGALSAAFADTASSEIGTLAPHEPRLITTGARVPHGTDGGVTVLGYAAALAACALLAGAAWALGFWTVIEYGHAWNAPAVPVSRGVWLSVAVVAAGLAGTTVDSLLGATIEPHIPRGGKHIVNFFCTLTGAVAGGGAGVVLYGMRDVF